MLKLVLIVLAVVAGIGIVVVFVGSLLPVAHVASRSAVFAAPPAQVFAVISDFARAPEWRPELKSVEMLPPAGGRPRFKEIGGDRPIAMEVAEIDPPRKLVTTIADKDLPFGGSWVFEVEPMGSGTRLTITEKGEVYNPLFRFMSRYVFGHTKTIETYLTNLGTKLSRSPAAAAATAAR